MKNKHRPNKATLLIYNALKKAIEKDKLRLYLDYGKINRPSSPVYNPWENLLPILVPILLGLLLIVFVSEIFGLLFIIAMIIIYSHVVKKILFQKIIERTKNYITSSYDNFCNLWDFGGLVLVNAENKKNGCVAPEGDWKEFVVNNFADYMLDEKPQDKKQEQTSEADVQNETDKK